MSKEIVKTTAKIKEIEVVDGQVLKCAGLQLCYPEAFFLKELNNVNFVKKCVMQPVL
jgi:hypothetical protein